ncbi:MAG: UTP--glucose-1-phosphate uridylyltransferase [Candidatus Altiarchaeales archaeon WOR_SM1_79]|nr:MAG: UTP--glucose-1-phosphate uridylyltransferase [Candidatus Altiarchaeales archaeon WOR_SM1_79]
MKVVIPAAGLGTRLLPATKAQPKEMLPVVDKPAIQYVVEEAVASGIRDILIITGRGKRAIEDHFDKSVELEYILKKSGKSEELREISRISDMANIFYIRQKEQLGLGHAVLCAKEHINDEPFAVMLGDDLIINEKPCIKQLLDVFEKLNSSIIAVEPVPQEMVHRYGIIKGKQIEQNLYEIEEIIEKPSKEKAPSNMATIGRYVLSPRIFGCIERTEPGVGGEIQLTDAIRLLLASEKVYAYEFTGKRYDIGTKEDWIKATIELALKRDELKHELKEFLKRID